MLLPFLVFVEYGCCHEERDPAEEMLPITTGLGCELVHRKHQIHFSFIIAVHWRRLTKNWKAILTWNWREKLNLSWYLGDNLTNVLYGALSILSSSTLCLFLARRLGNMQVVLIPNSVSRISVMVFCVFPRRSANSMGDTNVLYTPGVCHKIVSILCLQYKHRCLHILCAWLMRSL